jgi:hypothetical protein
VADIRQRFVTFDLARAKPHLPNFICQNDLRGILSLNTLRLFWHCTCNKRQVKQGEKDL